MAQQGWEQLSPRCHLCCREERETLRSPCGVGLWPQAQVGYPQSSVLLPVVSTELLDPLEGEPRAFHCPVSSCCSSRSQGAVVLQATFGKGCGRVTAVLAWNGDQVKVVTLLHEYLSPKQRPWCFVLPRFSVTSNPCTINNKVTKRRADKQISQLDCSSVRERFGYEVLSAKALPLHFLNQLLILS